MKMLDFNQVNAVNLMLRDKGIEYTMHLLGACACEGVILTQEGEAHSIDDICALINELFKDKFVRVRPGDPDPLRLIIE